MVNHRSAQIGPGQAAHQSPVVDHGQPADTAVDHHDRRPGEFTGRSHSRGVARDEGVDRTIGEFPAALKEDAERVGERAASSGHVIEAGQHGPHQVLLRKRPDELAVVIHDISWPTSDTLTTSAARRMVAPSRM